MKLVMTLLVHNEEDVLEANLEYHFAQGVDFVIATDHESTDATPAILQRYESMGVARVLRVVGSGHHQSRRVTRMARLAAVEHGADWVINNDADEFWWPSAGTLRDVLEAIPDAYGQVIARRNNFLPCSMQDHGAFYDRLIVRERCSKNLVGRPLEPKVAHRASVEVTVAPGNHAISGPGLVPAPSEELVEVLHFPMRSPGQFEQKVLATGIGYETLPFRGDEVGRDQLKLLELQRAGKLDDYFAERLLSADEIAEGLADQRLVIDRRLAQFMAERLRQPAPAELPGRPPSPRRD